MVTYTEKAFKSILNKHKVPDSWFWSLYSINPYNGCQFGCIYCDSRSSKYHLPTDFENSIVVKKNPSALLDQRLSRARTLRPDVTVLGGTTDPYQPAERTYRNTRNLLEVLARHLYPVHVVTKSRLVAEDAELINRIAGDTWATVSITISTADEKTARLLDYRAPSPAGRFQTIETLKKTAPNALAGVLAMPIVPALADKPNQLEDLVKRSKDAGADYLLFAAGLTLRDAQANWFLTKLSQVRPDVLPEFEKLYGFTYNGSHYNGRYGPTNTYTHRINQLMLDLVEKYQLAYRIPRWIPNDYRKINYQVAERLLNNAYYLSLKKKHSEDLYRTAQYIHQLTECLTSSDLESLHKAVQVATPRSKSLVEQYIQEAFH